MLSAAPILPDMSSVSLGAPSLGATHVPRGPACARPDRRPRGPPSGRTTPSPAALRSQRRTSSDRDSETGLPESRQAGRPDPVDPSIPHGSGGRCWRHVGPAPRRRRPRAASVGRRAATRSRVGRADSACCRTHSRPRPRRCSRERFPGTRYAVKMGWARIVSRATFCDLLPQSLRACPEALPIDRDRTPAGAGLGVAQIETRARGST